MQLCTGFEGVLNGLLRLDNADIYVTGSTASHLASDVLTEFRGRGDEVRVQPLSFAEFMSGAPSLSREEAWAEYFVYGGLPGVVSLKGAEAKSSFLKNFCRELCRKGIYGRSHMRSEARLPGLLAALASATGSFANPNRLAETLRSQGAGLSDKTIASCIGCLMDVFLISRVQRFDIKRRRCKASPFKYYFPDAGLLNAALNFRQPEDTSVMETILCSELLGRGCSVDAGIVEYSQKTPEGRSYRSNLEIDFVCNRGSQKYYVQTALAIPDEAAMQREQKTLVHVDDSFRKIIVVKDRIKLWRNEKGIVIMDIMDFLLKPNSLDL